MTTEAKSKLETYCRERLIKTGKYSPEQIDYLVGIVLSLKFLKTEASIDAFIAASK